MEGSPRGVTDPLVRQIEQAFQPGVFVHDQMCFSFVRGLEEVAAEIGRLVAADPVRAAALLETFLAGCHEKAEELDDSSGTFGQFVQELICGWVQAMQASDGDADETTSRLLAWMADDPYGFCCRIEEAVAGAFDRAGMAAFQQQVRARLEAAVAAEPAEGEPSGERPEYLRRRWGDVLRAIYLKQKNVTAYIALTEQIGLSAQDCHAVAMLLATKGKPEDALAWTDNGLKLAQTTPRWAGAEHDLTKLQRDLWVRLGRGDEALAAAWASFQKHSGEHTYGDLMKFVPEADRSVWHEKAMDAAKKADLGCVIDLFVGTNETIASRNWSAAPQTRL